MNEQYEGIEIPEDDREDGPAWWKMAVLTLGVGILVGVIVLLVTVHILDSRVARLETEVAMAAAAPGEVLEAVAGEFGTTRNDWAGHIRALRELMNESTAELAEGQRILLRRYELVMDELEVLRAMLVSLNATVP